MPAIVMGPALVLLNLAIAFVLTTGEVNTASNKQLPLPNDVYWSSDVEKKCNDYLAKRKEKDLEERLPLSAW